MYSEDLQNRIRNALRQRYAHLPLWYTMFYEHARTGDPVIRPLFYHYPSDTTAFDIDSQLLIGKELFYISILFIFDKNQFIIKNYF